MKFLFKCVLELRSSEGLRETGKDQRSKTLWVAQYTFHAWAEESFQMKIV